LRLFLPIPRPGTFILVIPFWVDPNKRNPE
jgi:hypothetical protein